MASESSAGMSVEIVKRQFEPRSKTKKPGIWVRASARFVEAQRKARMRQWTEVPAVKLLGDPSGPSTSE